MPPADWPQTLHKALTPFAQAIRDLTVRFLIDAQHGPSALLTDAARLEQAGHHLTSAIQQLLDPASRPDNVSAAETVQRTRHYLMNMLNWVLGYSQLLLEQDDEDFIVRSRDALQGICDLAKKC